MTYYNGFFMCIEVSILCLLLAYLQRVCWVKASEACRASARCRVGRPWWREGFHPACRRGQRRESSSCCSFAACVSYGTCAKNTQSLPVGWFTKWLHDRHEYFLESGCFSILLYSCTYLSALLNPEHKLSLTSLGSLGDTYGQSGSFI